MTPSNEEKNLSHTDEICQFFAKSSKFAKSRCLKGFWIRCKRKLKIFLLKCRKSHFLGNFKNIFQYVRKCKLNLIILSHELCIFFQFPSADTFLMQKSLVEPTRTFTRKTLKIVLQQQIQIEPDFQKKSLQSTLNTNTKEFFLIFPRLENLFQFSLSSDVLSTPAFGRLAPKLSFQKNFPKSLARGKNRGERSRRLWATLRGRLGDGGRPNWAKFSKCAGVCFLARAAKDVMTQEGGSVKLK